jgi:hypothetical protein
LGKKAFVAAIALSMTLISLFGMQAVNIAKANPIPWAFDPQMTVAIPSPENGTIYGLPVLVTFVAQGDRQFSVTDNASQDYAKSFFYVVDGQDMKTQGLRFAGTKTTEIPGYSVYKYSFSGQANLTDITDGFHSITVYYGAVNSIGLIGSSGEWIVYNSHWSATAQFYVNSTLPTSPSPVPTLSPTPTAAMNASLSESASALNFGNTINFTVSVEGGRAPYTYTWNIEQSSDVVLVETASSPYFSSNTFGPGSHHVSVEVKDAYNNTARTLTVEFNVLLLSSSPTFPSQSIVPFTTPTPSSSPTQQPTIEPSPSPNNTQENLTSTLSIAGIVVVIVAVSIGVIVYFKRIKK